MGMEQNGMEWDWNGMESELEWAFSSYQASSSWGSALAIGAAVYGLSAWYRQQAEIVGVAR